MVSLGNSNPRSPGSGGGYFFSPEVPPGSDDVDDVSLLSSLLNADEEPHFKTIPVTGTIIVEIFLTLGLFISVFVIPQVHPADTCFVLTCLHVGVWGLTLLASSYLHHRHCLLKRFGYLEFHRKTQYLQKVPLVVTSCGNAIFLIFNILLQRYCPDFTTCPVGSHMHCYYYIQLFICLETLILLPCLAKYAVLVIQFNQTKAGPDVNHDELLVNYMQSHAPVNEIGFRDEDYVEEILEKQADMIRYLKQHNVYLSRKILKLTEQLNSLRSTVERI